MDFFSSFFIALYVILGAYLILCGGRIATKAGYSGWFGALMIVPGLNLIILGILAFETWPILKTKDEIKAEKVAKLKSELSRLTGQQEVVVEKKNVIQETEANEFRPKEVQKSREGKDDSFTYILILFVIAIIAVLLWALADCRGKGL